MDSTKDLRVVFKGDTGSLVGAFNTVKQKSQDLEETTKSLGRQTQQTLESGGKSWLKLGAVMGLVGGIASTVTMRAMTELSSTIGDATKRVDTLNNANRTFDNMGFSTAAVKEAMKDLNKSILGLPTSLDQAVSGVELLAGATNDIKKAQQIYSAVNDAVIGFGGSAMDTKGAVIQLSQALSNGKVDAQTWNSLIQNGMGPALSQLARTMGLTTGQLKQGLSDGTVSVGKFEDELIKLDTKGGGSMKSLQKIAHDATSGIGTGFENARTAVVRGLADIVQAIGSKNISNAISTIGKDLESGLKAAAQFIPIFVHSVEELGGRLRNFLAPSMQALWNTIDKQLMPVLVRLWHEVIQPLLPVIGALFSAAIWLAINAFTALLQIITPVINFMLNHKQVVIDLALAFGTLAVYMKFEAITSAFLGNMESIIGKIGGVKGAVTDLFTKISGGTVMGGIAVGGALADIALVAQAVQSVLGAISAMNQAQQATAKYGDVTPQMKQIEASFAQGKISKATEMKLINNLTLPGNAAGTNYWQGGATWVGEEGPEIVNLPRGAQVIPAGQSSAMAGGGGGGNLTINVSVGTYAGSDSELRKFARDIYRVLQQEARANGFNGALPQIGVVPLG